MTARRASLFLGLLLLILPGLGCQSLNAVEPVEDRSPDEAQKLWLQGQEAMRQGQPKEAIRYYEQSLAADGEMKRNHLSIASAYVAQDDPAAAEPHLAKYLAAYPDHAVVRGLYADLLIRLGKMGEARPQFERYIADIQQRPELSGKLVRCHSRLMEIAESEGDEYSEHLQRGIGLVLLARERAKLPDADEGELSVESLLCKAAGELGHARSLRKNEARPSWYLYEVWSRLGQSQPALRHLREARAASAFTYLSPAEKRGLAEACDHCQATSPK
jgi:tetratricopeptide (TPR) repeat protein